MSNKPVLTIPMTLTSFELYRTNLTTGIRMCQPGLRRMFDVPKDRQKIWVVLYKKPTTHSIPCWINKKGKVCYYGSNRSVVYAPFRTKYKILKLLNAWPSSNIYYDYHDYIRLPEPVSFHVEIQYVD